MSTSEKSPLHPSALPMSGMKRGRRVITFNMGEGILGRYVILSRPYTVDVGDGGPSRFVIDVRCALTGERSQQYLSDMGVTRSAAAGLWNRVNFTIDSRKEHLLPSESQSINPYGTAGWLIPARWFDDEVPERL